MIRYFVLDLDGCLTYPFESPDWKIITAIRELQLKSSQVNAIPPLSLCTGRPQPYAEAVAQWLGIRHTIIFESGGGFYHPVDNKLTWSPHFTEEIEQKSREIRLWFTKEVLPQYPGMMLEFTKHTDVGMVHNNLDEIKKVYEIASQKIRDEYPEFEVHYTNVSVNIIVKDCNKASGLKFFAEQQNVSADEIAYIGDTMGDLLALKWVGAPFAPSNAIDEVKQHSTVMSEEATGGVLEAYQAIITSNKRLDKEAVGALNR